MLQVVVMWYCGWIMDNIMCMDQDTINLVEQ